MENLWNIVSGAPWWVFALFGYLVSIGVKATKPRRLPVKMVVLLPLLFVAWSLYSLYTKHMLGFSSLIPIWVVSLAAGAYLGMREVRSWNVSVDRHKAEITIPGNYSTLVLILLVFAVKFFFGYFYATHGAPSYQVYFWDTLSSALVSGFFVGRAGSFFRRYQKSS